MAVIDRVMMLVEKMSDDERAELFSRIEDEYCVSCGEELPEADAEEGHDCPVADDDDDEDDSSGELPTSSDDEDDEGDDEDEDEDEETDEDE